MERRLARFANELAETRKNFRFPPQLGRLVPEFLDRALGLLFPHLTQNLNCSPMGVEAELQSLELEARVLLSYLPDWDRQAIAKTVHAFVSELPEVHRKLLLDAEAIYTGDPAAESLDEVILAYPGFFAIATYRLANVLYRLGVPVIPRLMTEVAHRKTGIDIHPGATIGESFFIDHGTGVVIGETTVIGNNVKLYQGVTLGALYVSRSLHGQRRHPTLGDNVVVYAGATILGGKTVVGDNSIVGGNAWLTHSVPPNSIVHHTSEVRVRPSDQADDLLEFYI
ncbi:MAG: serine O-acetyltransferase EpsC [Fimbriimonadaceae bacterium]